MRHFALFIDNEVRGPLSEYEVQDLIAAGTATAETLCAPAGSTAWEPLSNHFTFGSTLKLNRAPAVERTAEETEAQANRLDPELRRNLLMYGLADGATVDQLAPAQAESALAARLAEIKSRRRVHQAAGLGAFLAALALGAFLGLGDTPVATLLGQAAGTWSKEDPKVTEQSKRLETDLANFEKLRGDAAAAVFAPPAGGTPAQPALLGRLRLAEGSRFNVSGGVDTAPLAGLVGKWNVKLDPATRLFLLPAAMPPEQAAKVEEQSRVLDVILSPLMDDAGFESLRQETVRNFPDLPGVPEAGRLKTEVENMKLAELKVMVDRVEFRARACEQQGTTANLAGSSAQQAAVLREWAPKLRVFAAQLRELHHRLQININPAARGKLWSEFNAGPGAELAAWVLGANAKEVKVDAQGSFVIAETGKLDGASAAGRLLATTQINNDTVYLAWGSKFLTCRDLASVEIPKEQLLAREEYKVVDKPVTGGRRCVAKGRVGGRELTIERTSPQWRFLTVAREKDADSLVVGVDAATYDKFAVGQVVPFETLAGLQVFARPVESTIPTPLSAAE
ncbi:MAG: hypothetical protein RLZZ550_241 [Verrucomicrobiota bacterium]